MGYKKIKNTHPGEILLREFLEPLKINLKKLDKEIIDVIDEKQSITYDIALYLSNLLGTSKEFWLGLQSDYDNAR